MLKPHSYFVAFQPTKIWQKGKKFKYISDLEHSTEESHINDFESLTIIFHFINAFVKIRRNYLMIYSMKRSEYLKSSFI